ncbi:type IV secretory system conjugative DNA transfer family protein [Rubrobacter indicoceani]|uniref:type IV secretory system conjugative DNA transfer family protein n=1 Tax=Rubrobacter indicoceani TaxID=2051957 RepID=UPI000E5B11A6|nr:hypothetical protein [Rubrobacter indicoceani]
MNRVPAETGFFYELGASLRDSGPELLGAAQNPVNLALGTAGLFACGAGFVGAHHATGPFVRRVHDALFRRPGEVMIGYRTLGAFGRVPLYLPLSDRFTGLQMVAPMGQAKTSTMEWLAYQDLRNGLSVFVVETEGDLGKKLLPLARWLGVPIRYFTYSGANDGSTMKWNPLSGDKVDAAERAVTAFQSAAASGDEKFFENFNSMFLRHSVLAVCTYFERRDRVATMSDLDRFVQNESFRRKVLGVERDSQGRRFTVNAKGLPRRTHGYWEDLYYGQYGQRERTQFVAGLHAVMDALLAQEIVEVALSPKAGDPVLDLTEALTSPGLTLVSVPQGAAPATSRMLSTWVMEYFRQAVLARPDGGYPVSAYLDEVHSMLGHANSEAALAFSSLITQSRRRHVAFNFAYQSFSLLPSPLKEALATNARNKLISGGQQGDDAAEAMRLLGQTEREVRDYRTTRKGLLGGPGSFSVGRRSQTVPRVSEEDLVYLPRGWWHCSRVRRGKQQRPVPVKAGRAPTPPKKYREEFAARETDDVSETHSEQEEVA